MIDTVDRPVDRGLDAGPKAEGEYQLKEVELVDLSLPAPANSEEEAVPDLHVRTWIAVAAFFLLNYVQVIALQGPATVLTYIGTDLGGTRSQAWVVVALSLTQGVIGPLIATASDTFQARKLILVVACTISFIGACIAPGSTNINRLIGANVLIGIGFAAVPLTYAVPSEILPRRWRPYAQAIINSAALVAALTGPFMIAALTKRNPHTGWRYFYWFQAALWGTTVLAMIFCYQPPKRHTGLEHLSFWGKFKRLDLVGSALLTTGLTLFLTGTALGGGLYAWTNATVLSTMIIGIVVMVVFGIYEWKGTKTGILDHDLFRGGRSRGRTFAICVGLFAVEGIMIFGFAVFYPVLCQALFTTDPVLIAGRAQAAWAPAIVSSVGWAWVGSRFRRLREPLFVGFAIFTGGIIGLATINPGQSTNAIGFSVLIGIGFGAPTIYIISAVQLSTPHHLIATATACTTSARAITGAVFSAVYTVVVNSRLERYLPEYVGKATLAAGLPATSLPGFIQALSTGDIGSLAQLPGADPTTIAVGFLAAQHAYADALRIVFIIGAPFGVLACVGCVFMGSLKDTMNYHIDAPVEKALVDKNQQTEAT